MLARVSALAVCLSFGAFVFGAKRPLTHEDYSSWKSIQSPALSRDGKWLAYGLFPQEGDGELVIRELATGKEHREPAGAQPAPGSLDDEEDSAPRRPEIKIRFSGDSLFVAASVFPAQAAIDQAKREKKKPAELPKSGLVMVQLEGFAATRAANVKTFQLAEKGGPWIAYHSDVAGAAAELVLRNMEEGAETRIADVTEFQLAADGGVLVYAQRPAADADASGVYVVTPGAGAVAAAIAQGRGKYAKLTWDRQQTQLAFLTDKDETASVRAPARMAIYHWTRKAEAATQIVAPTAAGLREGWAISDKGRLEFSRLGASLWFGTAPAPRVPVRQAEDGNAEDPVVADLWHWKDPMLQPMQKIRAGRERNRTYRAVYHFSDKLVRQIGDPTLADTNPSDDGLWATGSDDRPHQHLLGVEGTFADYYIVDARSGERTLLGEKLGGASRAARPGMIWSPDSKRVLFFRDKDWYTMAAPASAAYNLTRGLGAAFHQEQWDTPGAAPAYGQAGWTTDGRWVLLYDRYDVWQVAADGSKARRITDGVGREKKTVFRVIAFDVDEEGPRGIDSAKPLMLSAVDEKSRASGIWRQRLDRATPPEKLVMEDRRVAFVAKAKEADVVLAESTTFSEAPDLELTDSSFSARRKVSRANPQQEAIHWGAAELVSYRSADGEALQGILYKPEGFDPSKKYPLLVFLYERLTQTLHNFIPPAPGTSVNASYYVSNGYLVLMPDISYRIGSPGQSALKCVLPAVEAVVAQGFVDEAAIGIQGHSWGGYQVAYLMTQTNRFRAAIAGAPVGNMTSAYNGIRWETGLARQFMYEQTQSRIGGSLWTAPMKFIENSPVFMADRVRTPVLMLHDDDDGAVPWQQGIELFLSLRRNGKEAYLFNYNGEKHGLRKRPNQKDWTRRMQQYLDHYLKGAAKPEWMERGIPYLERIEEKLKQNGSGAAPAVIPTEGK